MTGLISKELAQKTVEDRKASEWEKLEKILLTVVGGSLGASATFFANNNEAHFTHRHILAFSWIFLSISLVSLLLSYIYSDYFTSDLLKKMKEDKTNPFTVDIFESLKSRKALWEWILQIIALSSLVYLV